MTNIQNRYEETLFYLKNNIHDLGFRRLIDCAMDTEDMLIYTKVIAFTDWKYKNPKSEEYLNKAINLLEEINNINLTLVAKKSKLIELKNASYSYGLNKFQLGPVSLEIHRGEVYGLVGENGNGKTSLLRILAKELPMDSGELNYFFKQEPRSIYDLRTKIAYVPQRTQKWQGSLISNLKFVLSSYGYPPKEIEPRVLIMIIRLGLWEYKDLQWSQLSSGYKMRFELARTLLRKPELLLLDEPLANLDILAQQVILEDLKYISNSLVNPLGLILSSQQLYEVEKVSDAILYLKKGKPFLDNTENKDLNTPLILEFESSNTLEDLKHSFKSINLTSIQYNGGFYVVEFPLNTSIHSVLNLIVEQNIQLSYFRDISQSSRRFFLS